MTALDLDAIKARLEVAGRIGHPHIRDSWLDVPVLVAEVERLRTALHVGMDLGNHHNARMCPYCTPDDVERERPIPDSELGLPRSSDSSSTGGEL